MSVAVWDRLRRVIVEFFEDDELELSEKTVASDVEDWDSLTNVELMIEIEREFGIRFRTGEMAELDSVGALARLIQRRVDESGS